MAAPGAIALLGLGLIGGSIGLALAQAGYPGRRAGYDPDRRTRQRAIERGAVDEAHEDAASAVSNAGLVIVAAPVLAIEGIFREIAPHLPPRCTVTDTASTKAQVVEWAALLPETVTFIAGHPMAGREVQGIEGALPGLFAGCTYPYIAPPDAPREAVEHVLWLIETVGGNALPVEAAEHDRAAAGISHLPLLLSTALVGATTDDSGWGLMSRLAASGYRDVSRLASGDPRMARDICLSNGPAIVGWIDRFTNELAALRDQIERGDPNLEARFADRKARRDAWIENAARV